MYATQRDGPQNQVRDSAPSISSINAISSATPGNGVIPAMLDWPTASIRHVGRFSLFRCRARRRVHQQIREITVMWCDKLHFHAMLTISCNHTSWWVTMNHIYYIDIVSLTTLYNADPNLLMTNPREISLLVSTSIPTNFYTFSILFRKPGNLERALWPLFSLLIQISPLRRINLFTSVLVLENGQTFFRQTIEFYPVSAHGLWHQQDFAAPALSTRHECLSILLDVARKTPYRGGNYAYELHQVMMMLLSRVRRTSCD